MITDLSKLDEKDAALLTKHAFEESRYIRECRKEALHRAHLAFPQTNSGKISKEVLDEADKYFNWLVNMPDDISQK